MNQRGLRAATWNVWTLKAPASKILLYEELRKNKVSIPGLTETRHTRSGEERVGNGDSLLWSTGSRRKYGVSLALNIVRKVLLLHEAVSDRLVKARFGHKHGKMTVFVCYAPTNDSDDVTKENFYSDMSKFLATVPPPNDITVLLGDSNVKVHDDMGVWRGKIGPASPDSLKDNGLNLLELCGYYDLCIAHTHFQRKTIHQYTWYSKDGRTKKMIDYVIISKRWRS